MDKRNTKSYQEKTDIIVFTKSCKILCHYSCKPFKQTVRYTSPISVNLHCKYCIASGKAGISKLMVGEVYLKQTFIHFIVIRYYRNYGPDTRSQQRK